MGWAYSAGRSRGGGEDIPPLRARRLRVAVIAVGLVLSCGLGGYPIVTAVDLRPIVSVLGVLGVFFTGLAFFSRIRFVGAVLSILAAEYILTEAAGHATRPSIIGYAVGLMVLCELVFLADRLAGSARVDVSAVLGWSRGLALIAVGSALLSLVALAAAGLRMPGSFTGTIVGSTAALVLLALPWLLSGAGAVHRDKQRRSE